MKRFDVFLVDDNDCDAQIFQFSIQEARKGTRVCRVATCAEALDFLRGHGRFESGVDADLIILDLNLPDDSGFRVLQAIKGDADWKRKPVLVLSGSGAQEDVDLAYSLGANAYFRKPMSLQSLNELLHVLAAHWLDLVSLPTSSGNLDITAVWKRRAQHDLVESPVNTAAALDAITGASIIKATP